MYFQYISICKKNLVVKSNQMQFIIIVKINNRNKKIIINNVSVSVLPDFLLEFIQNNDIMI